MSLFGKGEHSTHGWLVCHPLAVLNTVPMVGQLICHPFVKMNTVPMVGR